MPWAYTGKFTPPSLAVPHEKESIQEGWRYQPTKAQILLEDLPYDMGLARGGSVFDGPLNS